MSDSSNNNHKNLSSPASAKPNQSKKIKPQNSVVVASNQEDNKPQSQINKCLNEKRRREQENIYIEELAELISASIQDMSSLSVKPDKCAILQETVNQIRRIKAAEELAVQQGEVSSSTNILANEILCPLVLEALDGFLFVVNTDGIVEFCSENVSTFILYTQTELLGKSIYNIIHLSDHARFSSSLLPMSIGWVNRDNQIATTSSNNTEKLNQNQQRSFNIRVLVKSDGDSSYENMQITAMLMPHPVAQENSADNCLVCIARRLPPNERPPGTPVEQFTTKLSTDGCIIGVDNSGLSVKFSQVFKKDHLLLNTLIQELCLVSDLPKLDGHLRETLQNGSSTSLIYKLKLSPEKYVQVQTKSKFFAFNNSQESQDFIMATHTIINNNEEELDLPPTTPVPVTNDNNNNNENENDGYDFDSFVSNWPELVDLTETKPVVNFSPSNQDSPLIPNLAGTWGLSSPSPHFYDEVENDNSGDRLRNLLTLQKTANNNSENKILKGLLNQDDNQDDTKSNMLLNLLNENKSNHGNELLQQLLGNNGGGSGGGNQGVKRGMDMEISAGGYGQPPQKQLVLAQVGPPAPGELCKRNPRLVSLLAKQPEHVNSIPQVPSNYISGTPQEKLLNQIYRNNPMRLRLPSVTSAPVATVTSLQMSPHHHQQQQQIQHHQQLQQPNLISPQQQQQQQNQQQINQQNQDLILDEILDQVIDIVPDTSSNILLDAYYSDDVSNILNMLESSNREQQIISPEVAKINAIQKELMQFEQTNYKPVVTTAPVYIQRTTTTTTTSITARVNQNNQQNQNNQIIHQNQQVSVPQPPPNTLSTSINPAPHGNNNHQLLKQQLLLQHAQQQQLQQQRQRQQALLLLQQQQQSQQPMQPQHVQLLRELQLQLRQQNQLQVGQGQQVMGQVGQVQQVMGQVGGQQQQQQIQGQMNQSLDSLLGGNVPPPNVTLLNQQQIMQQQRPQQLTPQQQQLQLQQQILRQRQQQQYKIQSRLLPQNQQNQNQPPQNQQQNQTQNQQQQQNPMLNAQLGLSVQQQPRLIFSQQNPQNRQFILDQNQLRIRPGQFVDVRQEIRAMVGARNNVPDLEALGFSADSSNILD